MKAVADFLARLSQEEAVLVRVVRTEGSVPREAGAWMAVWREGLQGTIGGGHLEFEAIATARALLAAPAGTPAPAERRVALGPSLGQCCGGVVHLAFERVAAADAARLGAEFGRDAVPVALFGGGHVGAAVVGVLARLPVSVTWIDSREGIFPPEASAPMRARIAQEHSDPVQAAVPLLAPGSRVLIMSFSHAEDLDILAACLKRQRERADLPYIGLIGSRTKWATFRHRLEARGFGETDFACVTSPIGIPGIEGKQPEVIAIAVAAQLLQTLPSLPPHHD